ncbi:hypothetical protein TNCV_999621 [Trichonephila clavipes]|nr:hypothetical protein TNCV_999621 [Trichonephila clavipes]
MFPAHTDYKYPIPWQRIHKLQDSILTKELWLRANYQLVMNSRPSAIEELPCRGPCAFNLPWLKVLPLLGCGSSERGCQFSSSTRHLTMTQKKR